MGANEYALDQYLKRLDDDDRREEAIVDLANHYYSDDYNPYIPENFAEAVSELPVNTLQKIIDGLRDDNEFVIPVLREVVEAYWQSYCLNKARNDVDTYEISP